MNLMSRGKKHAIVVATNIYIFNGGFYGNFCGIWQPIETFATLDYDGPFFSLN